MNERLARLRVPLAFVAGAVVLWIATPSVPSVLWGSAIAGAGEALRFWAAGHLNKSREVTASGPYRFFAHPLYVGSSIMGAGLAIATSSWSAAVLIAAYLAVLLTAAIRSEEAFLQRAFGADYERYRRRAIGAGESASARRFSLRQAIANREHRAVAGFALVVLLLLWKATYNGMFWGTAVGSSKGG